MRRLRLRELRRLTQDRSHRQFVKYWCRAKVCKTLKLSKDLSQTQAYKCLVFLKHIKRSVFLKAYLNTWQTNYMPSSNSFFSFIHHLPLKLQLLNVSSNDNFEKAWKINSSIKCSNFCSFVNLHKSHLPQSKLLQKGLNLNIEGTEDKILILTE